MLNLLRGLLLDNLGLKLVALLLAVVLYLHVYTERPATMVISFPFEITDLADTLSLSGEGPDPVRAELRGTGKMLLRLRLTEPRIKLSLAGVGPGRYERTITPGDLPLLGSEQIDVQRLIDPRVVEFEIERRLVRRIPVAPRVSGVPRNGWVWSGAVLARPEVVRVRGPWGAVARLDSVRLQPVRLNGRADTVRATTGADSLPRWCQMEPAEVRLLIGLARSADSTRPR